MWVSKSKMESLEYSQKAAERAMRDYRERADEVFKDYCRLKASLEILYPEFCVGKFGLDVNTVNSKAQAVKRARQAKADAKVLKEFEAGHE